MPARLPYGFLSTILKPLAGFTAVKRVGEKDREESVKFALCRSKTVTDHKRELVSLAVEKGGKKKNALRVQGDAEQGMNPALL